MCFCLARVIVIGTRDTLNEAAQCFVGTSSSFIDFSNLQIAIPEFACTTENPEANCFYYQIVWSGSEVK